MFCQMWLPVWSSYWCGPRSICWIAITLSVRIIIFWCSFFLFAISSVVILVAVISAVNLEHYFPTRAFFYNDIFIYALYFYSCSSSTFICFSCTEPSVQMILSASFMLICSKVLKVSSFNFSSSSFLLHVSIRAVLAVIETFSIYRGMLA